MHTTAHSIISGSIAIGLAVFTALSATFAGLAASTTLLGVSLFVMLGLFEITILSYATPKGVLRGPRRPESGIVVSFPTTKIAHRRAA